MFIDSLFLSLDKIISGINDFFGQPIDHYSRLETAIDDNILIADDGSMITIIEVLGDVKLPDQETFSNNVDKLYTSLASRFESSAHLLQVCMIYNPYEAKNEIRDSFAASRATAANIGLNAASIMDDWEETLCRYCSSEKIFFVLWTKPQALPPAEVKQARKNMNKNYGKIPYFPNIQKASKIMTEIMNDHLGFINLIELAFKENGLLFEVLENHKACWLIRHQVDPSITSRSWSPLLPGDKLPFLLPELGENSTNAACLLYPSLNKQLFPRRGENIDLKSILIGDEIHSPLMISIPPQTPKPFNHFLKKMINKKIPWRASFFINGDGLSYLNWKSILASIFHFSSTVNKKFNKAIDELKLIDMTEVIVAYEGCFDTWVKAPANLEDQSEKTKAMEKLREQSSILSSAIQAWGTCDVGEITGDPLLGVCATIPGLMAKSPAPKSAPPLREALKMIPFSRPASPWKNGSIILRTTDGKIMPYLQGSSLQNAWIDVGCAPMGGGKSVWLNTQNWGFLTQPGLSRLPWLSILDIGPSSNGLITLVKNLLPDHLKHLAVYYRLRLTEEYSINPCDTLLGCHEPLPTHKAFLQNLLSLFATPLNEKAPQDGVPGIALMVIEEAFKEFSPERNPKQYNPGVDDELAEVIDQLAIHINEGTTWWSIVEELFKRGYINEAVKAQRYAVPLIPDMAGIVVKDTIKRMYDFKTPTGEHITDFFRRSLLEAIKAYPILKNPTQFDIGNAQVISLDLDEVSPRGGPAADRQTGVMFMLGRYIVGSKFFLVPSDVQLIPDIYKKYHAKIIQNIRKDPKRICWDEVHRVTSNKSIEKQIVGDMEVISRESRKQNLHMGLYSQVFTDIPEIVLEMATSIFILGAGTDQSIDDTIQKLGLSGAAKRAIQTIGKPDKSGANMVVLFKTELGNVTQKLTNTIGGQALWAFSSTSEDMTVRNSLYEKIGVEGTLKILSQLYPGGLKKEVEKRKMLRTSLADEFEESFDVETEIENEILMQLNAK